jgi:hypothetical protein
MAPFPEERYNVLLRSSSFRNRMRVMSFAHIVQTSDRLSVSAAESDSLFEQDVELSQVPIQNSTCHSPEQLIPQDIFKSSKHRQGC